jgi:hypothetical protein
MTVPVSAILTRLPRESGIETPSREDPARIDCQQKKKGSNQASVSRNEADARIDCVPLQAADLGDDNIPETPAETAKNVARLIEREAEESTGCRAAGHCECAHRECCRQIVKTTSRKQVRQQPAVNHWHGKQLLKKRGELIERSFADVYLAPSLGVSFWVHSGFSLELRNVSVHSQCL